MLYIIASATCNTRAHTTQTRQPFSRLCWFVINLIFPTCQGCRPRMSCIDFWVNILVSWYVYSVCETLRSFISLLSQVFLFFCETCSMPICRECSAGRHMGHSFIYLQDAVQDCRAITIQLLADAQQGRQAVQVRREPLHLHREKILTHLCLFVLHHWISKESKAAE